MWEVTVITFHGSTWTPPLISANSYNKEDYTTFTQRLPTDNLPDNFIAAAQPVIVLIHKEADKNKQRDDEAGKDGGGSSKDGKKSDGAALKGLQATLFGIVSVVPAFAGTMSILTATFIL